MIGKRDDDTPWSQARLDKAVAKHSDEVSDEALNQEGRLARFAIQQRLASSARAEKKANRKSRRRNKRRR